MSRVQPIQPKPGQESVWDYPRPPLLEPVARSVRAVLRDVELASSKRAQRVLETSHPPVYYVPPADARMDLLERTARTSFCEWKGVAVYYDARIDGELFRDVAWAYPEPTRRFEGLRDCLAFYLPKIDAGYVGDERAQPQPGGFYGGWITADVVGPFKGDPGTSGW